MGDSTRSHRIRNLFVVTQVALAWVLLAVLGLVVALAVLLFQRSPLGRSLQRRAAA